MIREVARRILADATGKVTCATEAARLNREGVPAPTDRRAQIYARPQKGSALDPEDREAHSHQRGSIGLPHARRTAGYRHGREADPDSAPAMGPPDPRRP